MTPFGVARTPAVPNLNFLKSISYSPNGTTEGSQGWSAAEPLVAGKNQYAGPEGATRWAIVPGVALRSIPGQLLRVERWAVEADSLVVPAIVWGANFRHATEAGPDATGHRGFQTHLTLHVSLRG